MSEEKDVYHIYAPQDETADTETDRAIADRHGNIIDETYLTTEDLEDVKTDLNTHINNHDNPHLVTKSQIGLGDVDNTSDLNKPVSTATQAALDLKADKSEVYAKQDKLISGENIKTINNESILGSGNLAIKDCVQTFASRADFPAEGLSAIIYIAQDTDKQYSWDNGEYVELSKEDEIERIYVNNSTLIAATLTPEQIKKAHEGKLILYEGMEHSFYSIGKNSFESDIHITNASYLGRNLLPSGAHIGGMTASFSDATGQVLLSPNHNANEYVVPLVQDNFFDASVSPTTNGKKLVREMNIAGKIAPSYTIDDANKVLKVNPDGTSLVFGEDTVNGIEVVYYQTMNPLTDEQVAKARVGKLAIDCRTGSFDRMLFFGQLSGATVIFRSPASIGTNTPVSANFPSSKEVTILEIPLNTTTRMLGSYEWIIKDFAEDASANVFASNVAPANGGRRIVREMNIAGKVIPSYTSLDAGKHVAINSEGNGIELVNDTFATDLEAKRLFRTKYDVTVNVTNGVFTGDVNIWTRETASVTLTPNADYALPGKITVTNASYVYNDITGVVVISKVTGNVTITCVCVPVPSKGDLITMDGKTFRVLKMDGRKCDVMCLTNETCAYYDSNPQTVSFDISGGTYTGLKYENSTLDTYLNETWFGALSSDIQNAIIEQEVVQDLYNVTNTTLDNTILSILSGVSYRINRISVQSHRLSNKRKVRELNVNDLCEYFDYTTDDVPASDVRMMIFNQSEYSSLLSDISLISAYYSGNYNYCCEISKIGYVSNGSNSISRGIRPVFKLDISQVTWTIQQ